MSDLILVNRRSGWRFVDHGVRPWINLQKSSAGKRERIRDLISRGTAVRSGESKGYIFSEIDARGKKKTPTGVARPILSEVQWEGGEKKESSR